VYPNIASDGAGTSLVAGTNNTELSDTTEDLRGALLSEEVDPIAAIEALQAELLGLALSSGTSHSLVPLLDRALVRLQDGNAQNDRTAIQFLEQFISQVGKKQRHGIDDAAAADLTANAQAIIANLTGSA